MNDIHAFFKQLHACTLHCGTGHSKKIYDEPFQDFLQLKSPKPTFSAQHYLSVIFLTRCCYLLWDCCTDSYWGCCPRRRACKRFMLLKCCKPKTPGHEDFDTDTDDDAYLGGKYEYQVRTISRFLTPSPLLR